MKMSASSAVIHLHHRRREELVEVIADDQIVEQKQQPSDDREDRNPQPNNSDSDNNNNAAAASSPAQSQAQTPIMHIVLNVGGMRYETSSETIRRIPYTRLTRLLDENADGSGGEIFIDRCGALFHLVLNFLRSGTIASEVVDKDPEIIDRLEKEAQFYGISELANLCRSERDALKPNELVCWRASAIPHYWRVFVKCLVDKALQLPFTYERNALFFAKCIACDEVVEPRHCNTYAINFEEWSAVAHHMETMSGKVEKVIGNTCVSIRWSNGAQTHLPRSAVRRLIR